MEETKLLTIIRVKDGVSNVKWRWQCQIKGMRNVRDDQGSGELREKRMVRCLPRANGVHHYEGKGWRRAKFGKGGEENTFTFRPKL